VAEQEPTLGEIMRRLEELSLEVRSIPLRFEETFLRREVYRSEHSHMTERVHKLESRSEWVVRTVGALVIGVVFGVALMLGK
jgi:hypothetical protein